ncbi:hypothetical protein ACFSHT_11805 [Paraburkholderia silviterrae]|uniref:Uncharacterized protein n=1 Tax=Paraburkholderia silviterrae TaxID=2528715 RepID=A0A4R5MEQ4_9BURK|nr:hypothetical protein [Paraburkholderia silviterrae]TDG25612.1 hypothetical protein EYW47_07290 [Paraburkholderia silviterrae]
MNKPSERIVVFVTPAQKRAISATADELGISISELMRRAVIAFSATSDQVKAANIVDRLNAPRAPDALAQVLRKAARPLRAGRAAGLRPAAAESAAADAQVDGEAAVPLATGTVAPLPTGSSENAAALPASGTEPDTGSSVRDLAQAVARLSGEAAQAAEDAEAQAGAALPEDAHGEDAEPLQPRGGTPFAHATRDEEKEAHRNDPAPDAGKFA